MKAADTDSSMETRPELSARLRAGALAARRMWWAARPRAAEHAFRAARGRFYRRFWRDAAAAVGAELRALDAGYLHATRGVLWTVMREDHIALDDHLRVSLARNKLLTAALLAPFGFITPEAVAFDLASLDKALALLGRAEHGLVIKPDGVVQGRFFAPVGPGAGRGVTCGVRTAADLVRAARWASLFGARLIAEELVPGASYRLLYLDGRLIDAVRRDPPRVFGDGVSTIAELIAAENAERRAARPLVALHPLVIDLDCRLALARQRLRPGSVARALEAVVVKTVCNENAAYDNHVVRGAIHPELARLGGELTRRLGLRLAGVDVMCPDASQPPAPGTFFFNEVNATPGLHHHCLVAEPERRAPVGAMVLEAALSGAA